MAAAQAFQIVFLLEFRHGEQPAINGRNAMQHGHFVFLDGGQNILRRGAAGEDCAGDAVAQREKQIVAERADKTPFACGHDDIMLLRWQAVAVQVSQGNDPAMRMDDALGSARRAGGVDDKSGFVAPRVGCSDGG